MSCVAGGTKQNVLYLREHGPTPVPKLPGGQVSIGDKQAGVWKFTVAGNRHRDGITKGSGGGTAVAYLADEHDRETVVRAWLDANPSAAERRPRRGLAEILNRHGRQWRDAVRAALDDWYGSQEADDE